MKVYEFLRALVLAIEQADSDGGVVVELPGGVRRVATGVQLDGKGLRIEVRGT